MLRAWTPLVFSVMACAKSSPNASPNDLDTGRQQARRSGQAVPTAVEIRGDQGPVRVEVEVVRTPESISRGLMFREHLPLNAGMLFFMYEVAEHSFWMRNTLIPLDMVFITEDLKIAGVVENAEPRTDTSRRVNAPSLYVLEVNGGWTRSHGVGAGDPVEFIYGSPDGTSPPK